MNKYEILIIKEIISIISLKELNVFTFLIFEQIKSIIN